MLLSLSLRVIIKPEDLCSTSAVAHNLAAPIKARSRTFSLHFPLCLPHTGAFSGFLVVASLAPTSMK